MYVFSVSACLCLSVLLPWETLRAHRIEPTDRRFNTDIISLPDQCPATLNGTGMRCESVLSMCVQMFPYLLYYSVFIQGKPIETRVSFPRVPWSQQYDNQCTTKRQSIQNSYIPQLLGLHSAPWTAGEAPEHPNCNEFCKLSQQWGALRLKCGFT